MDQPLLTRRPWWALAAGVAALALVTTTACGDDDDDAGTDTTEADEAADESSDEGADYGGGSDDDAEGASGSADATLEVTEFEFDDVTAPAGGTLEVVNSSGGGHTFTADDGAFDEAFGDGNSVIVDVPAEPGDYPFHCEIHPDMTGTLTAE